VPYEFNFIQTGCKAGVSGLSLNGPYTQNILNLTDLNIDISSVSNKDCNYKLSVSKILGPANTVSSFMNIVQPTFGAEVSFIFPTTVPGSLSVAALTGTTI
jgi:hypothetical protein